MRTTIWDQYRSKLRTADEAAKLVKSGDWVNYSQFGMTPVRLDEALARRVGELTDVKVSTSSSMYPVQVAVRDPQQKSFTYHSTFLSSHDRALHRKGLCFFTPSNFHEQPSRYRNGYYPRPNVAMITTTTMDKNGFFNFGPGCTYMGAVVEMADKVIVEVNEAVPLCLGGYEENIHISKVDCIVETEARPLITIEKPEPTEEDKKIAELLIDEIPNGACLQLGIGGVPNAVGSLIAESDLKDFGVHSEMMCDAYLDLYQKGKINGRNKYTNRNKMVYTFSMGSQKLYEFLDNNPACAIFPVDYTNSLENVARNDNVISINNALQIDLFGQTASEAIGGKQISGSGGQGDFVIGATKSNGGKAFICLHSTRMVKGERMSCIVPDVQGIVSIPRANAFYVVTEFGKVNLKGKTSWQIAEALISIAHPDFQEGLIKCAQEKGLWRNRSLGKGAA